MATNKTVRFITFTFTNILTNDDDGSKDGKCKFGGYIGEVLQDCLQPLTRYINCSIKTMESFGKHDPITNTYGGMIGEIQKKNADMLAMPVYFPLMDPNDEYFDYGTPLFEDTIMIVSPYHIPTKREEEGNILYMFTGIPHSLWWAVLVNFLLFILALKFGQLMGNLALKAKPIIFMVASAFLSEDNFPEDDIFSKIINAVSANFFFFFGNYLLNSMATDLVLFSYPDVVRTYEDFLAHADMSAFIVPGLPLDIDMSLAPAGSVIQQVYAKRSKIAMDINEMLRLVPKQAMDYKLIFIAQEFVTKMIVAKCFAIAERGAGLSFANYPSTRALFSIDPTSKKYTNIMVFGKHMDPYSKELCRNELSRTFEAGLFDKLVTNIWSKTSDQAQMIVINKFRTQVVVEDETPLPLLTLGATAELFLIMIICMIVAFGILILETMAGQVQKMKMERSKKRQREATIRRAIVTSTAIVIKQ